MIEGTKLVHRNASDVFAAKSLLDSTSGDYIPIQKMLWKWFFQEWDAVYKKHDTRIPIDATFLLGCPVWGTKYINRFLFLTLPSLLADGNLPRINGTKSHLLLYSDYAGRAHLNKELAFLKGYNITYEVRLIPASILRLIKDHPYNKFWILGTVQNISIQYARLYGMAFHMLMPDHVYSRNYFSNLALLGAKHPLILQQSISGDLDQCGPILASCLNGYELSVDAKGLADVAFYHLHPQIQPMLMNSRNVWDEISLSNYLLWVSRESLQIYCPHVSMMFMSAEQIQKRTQAVLYNALDTVIPYFIEKDVTPYFPTLEDDMVFVELSDQSKQGYSYSIKFPEFAMRFACVPQYEDINYLNLYEKPSVLPVSQHLVEHMMRREGREAMSVEDISGQMAGIIRALRNSREPIHRIRQQVDPKPQSEAA